MTASREASRSARFRVSSPSRRSPARHATVTTTVAMPRTTKLVRSDVRAISTGASTAPSTIAATDRASNTPMTRPSTSARTTRARVVSATTSQATKPAPPSRVTSSAIASSVVHAYASCVAQNIAPATTTMPAAFVLAASRALTVALSSPPSPATASR